MFFLVLAVKMNQFFDIGITSSLKFLLVAKAHKNLQNHIFIPCTYQTLLKIQKDAVYIFYETCSSDQQILLSKTSVKTQQTYIGHLILWWLLQTNLAKGWIFQNWKHIAFTLRSNSSLVIKNVLCCNSTFEFDSRNCGAVVESLSRGWWRTTGRLFCAIFWN